MAKSLTMDSGLRTKNKKKKASNTLYFILNTSTATRYFPQIYRKIPADFKIFLILVLVFWLSLLFLPSSPLENLKIAILKNLKSPEFHLSLADEFLKNNQVKEAENEILFSLQFSPDNPSLLQKLEEIRKIKKEPERISQEIQKWEKIVRDKPDYRDGYFQLAILHYQLYNNSKTKEYLNKVLSLDPNFSAAKELLTKIK